MPSLNTIPSFSNGQVPTAAQMQTFPTAINAVSQLASGWPVGSGPMRKPDVRLVLFNVQSVPNGADTAVTWDTEEQDADNTFALSYPAAIRVRTAGWWWVDAQVAYPYASAAASTLASERNVCICVNGTANANVTASSNTVQSYNNNQRIQVSSYEHLAAGSTIYVRTYQASGAALTLLPTSSAATTGAAWGTWLTLRWDAPY